MAVAARSDPSRRAFAERRSHGRPRHVPIPIAAMRRDEGRALTPRDLAGLSEMSEDKIRGLLARGSRWRT
jgi:hypothetical protein